MNTSNQTESQPQVGSTAGLGALGGLRIVESHLFVKQWRFPRSKKRRIRKKWAAVKTNWRPDDKIYRMGNMITCHPVMAAKLRKQLCA